MDRSARRAREHCSHRRGPAPLGTDRYSSVDTRDIARAALETATGLELAAEERESPWKNQVLHPYFGFDTPRGTERFERIADLLCGADREELFVVALTGASIAESCSIPSAVPKID